MAKKGLKMAIFGPFLDHFWSVLGQLLDRDCPLFPSQRPFFRSWKKRCSENVHILGCFKNHFKGGSTTKMDFFGQKVGPEMEKSRIHDFFLGFFGLENRGRIDHSCFKKCQKVDHFLEKMPFLDRSWIGPVKNRYFWSNCDWNHQESGLLYFGIENPWFSVKKGSKRGSKRGSDPQKVNLTFLGGVNVLIEGCPFLRVQKWVPFWTGFERVRQEWIFWSFWIKIHHFCRVIYGFSGFGPLGQKPWKRGPKMGPKTGPPKKSEKMAKQTWSARSRGSTHPAKLGNIIWDPFFTKSG